MRLIFIFETLFIILVLAMTASSDLMLKGTHWTRIGKRTKFINVKDIARGKH
jgi:hypothetical protein